MLTGTVFILSDVTVRHTITRDWCRDACKHRYTSVLVRTTVCSAHYVKNNRPAGANLQKKIIVKAASEPVAQPVFNTYQLGPLITITKIKLQDCPTLFNGNQIKESSKRYCTCDRLFSFYVAIILALSIFKDILIWIPVSESAFLGFSVWALSKRDHVQLLILEQQAKSISRDNLLPCLLYTSPSPRD